MLTTFEGLFPNPGVLPALRQYAQAHQKIYLVGGCVRDLLLNKKIHDLDITTNGDTLRLARTIANQLKGAFFVLDDSRHIARVILRDLEGKAIRLDFAALRGAGIEDDLIGRDFTINALAVDLNHPERIIDPLHGGRDLREKILRSCRDSAFSDDPVRVIRAVRFSVTLGLQIEPVTLKQMRVAVPRLERVSMERKRDEFFHLLGSRQVFTSLTLLDRLGICSQLIPELDTLKNVAQSTPHTLPVWEHTLETVRWLEALYDSLTSPPDPDNGENLILGMALLALGRFRSVLQRHFLENNPVERPLRSLLFFAALLHDIAKPVTRTIEPNGIIRFLGHEQRGVLLTEAIARRLLLSNQEIDRLKRVIAGHMRIHNLASTGSGLSRRSIYRYYQQLGAAGVDICMLSLADTIAKSGVTISPSDWERELLICQQLLEAWFEKREEWIAPPRLVSGYDVMSRFALKPGEKIGKLLDIVQEAHASGQIQTREEAFDLLDNWLKDDAQRDMRENHGIKDG